jgi:hypothetical protein
MKLGIPVYEGVNSLDVARPLEMFTWVGAPHSLETLIISEYGEPVTSISNLGKMGVPAQTVGEQAAKRMAGYLGSEHLLDPTLPISSCCPGRWPQETASLP